MRILVSGGCGFIGSAVVRRLVRARTHEVLVLDKLTYAGSEAALEETRESPRLTFVVADIADRETMRAVFADFEPDAVLHLAAETHVDRSIDDASVFLQTNVFGTFVLLEAARAHWMTLAPAERRRFRFVHVSTDEVFGSLGPDDPPFTARSRYAPRSPYAASKAAADHLARAWFHTYGLPTIVSNGTNSYGPWQFPEKLVPRIIRAALAGEELPIYGDGSNRRDWLYVEDHADALIAMLERGAPGESYSVGGRAARSNLEVVRMITDILDHVAPDPAGSYARLIRFVADRPGHDFRYEIDPSVTERALGWVAACAFRSGLERTIAWYLAHRTWLAETRRAYAGERLGAIA